MRIMVIGASGTIGSALSASLERHHDVVPASRTGDVTIDLRDTRSISSAFERVGTLDAVVCCAAHGPLIAAADTTGAAYEDALRAKLVGQIHVVHESTRHVRAGGSVTVTSGRFDRTISGAATGASINAALETYIRVAAAELAPLRVNAVSPGWVAETLAALDMDPRDGVPATHVASMYERVIHGSATGTVIHD